MDITIVSPYMSMYCAGIAMHFLLCNKILCTVQEIMMILMYTCAIHHIKYPMYAVKCVSLLYIYNTSQEFK